MKISDRYSTLPVAAIADKVNASLAIKPRLVITAPPGAGKSTLLPLSLLEDLPAGKILMLEPRRLAARQVASRMASMLGEPCGRTVGYRVRFDTCVSHETRIEVLTEGILERMLVEDPTLDGVSVVIFDEFHERSLTSDMTLALTLESQSLVRPDLQIVIMSATIDADLLCKNIDAPLLHCDGKLFDVDIIHTDDFNPRECAATVASAVRRAHREQSGDILAFLPGQAEILKCIESLGVSLGPTRILPLYGMMSPEQQRYTLSPTDRTSRRVILATPIAETSLTIEGITTVVDSGLCRTLVFDPSSGLSRLATVPISFDMATQRAGRAGRLSNGTCYRLWSKAAEHRMKTQRVPEILSADLAPMILEIAAWGESDPMRLPWITPPPTGHVAHGREMLQNLDALDTDGRITRLGQRLSLLPCHPRIARMLVNADDEKESALACDIAALLEEKDPLNNENDADIDNRIALLRQYRRKHISGRWQRIADIAAQYRRLIGAREDNSPIDPEICGRLIAQAYPERVAMLTDDGRYRLAGGEFTTVSMEDPLCGQTYLAIASMDKRIFLAAPISRTDISDMGTWIDNVGWDPRQGRVVARRELRVGTLVLETRPAEGELRSLILDAVCKAAPKYGLTMFDLNDDVRCMQVRIATAAEWHPELNLPHVDTDTLLSTAEQWLPLYIGKASTTQELRKIDMSAVIWGLLDYESQNAVDRIAPSHISLPCGRNVRIDYRHGAEAPVVKARLQDCFGLMETPRLDDGRRPVLMELLSPGFKPVQLTQDMKGFWQTTYHEVRKELRRRYPKHKWPEDPLL